MQSSLSKFFCLYRIKQDVFFCLIVKPAASGMYVPTAEEKSLSFLSSFWCDFINELEGSSSLW